MATYSAFFSSGLLAPPFALKVDTLFADSSPSMPSPSPAFDDVSDIETDGRGTTPTMACDKSGKPAPRLRKRRSSLSVNQSAMNVIKSPTRSASNAYAVQRHLGSPSRARSGSLSSNLASQGTSLVGRMRSGSLGTSLRPASRKTGHRSAPSLPPPSAPLPALPPKYAFRLSGDSIDEEMKEN